jgi:nicotinamidase-related amidase
MTKSVFFMDVQRITVAYIGDDHTFLNRLVGAIDTARKAEMMVIYVRAGFREGYPEIGLSSPL